MQSQGQGQGQFELGDRREIALGLGIIKGDTQQMPGLLALRKSGWAPRRHVPKIAHEGPGHDRLPAYPGVDPPAGSEAKPLKPVLARGQVEGRTLRGGVG